MKARTSTHSKKSTALAFWLAAILLCAVPFALSACSPSGPAPETDPSAQSTQPAVSDVMMDAQSAEQPAAADQAPDGSAASIVDGMTLEEKVAQMFIVRPEAITGVDVAVQAGESTKAALEQYPVGGIIYFGDNLENADQTRAMLSATQEYATEAAGIPAFLCVDEEGGTVSRVGGTEGFGVENVGDMRDVGATGDTAYAKEVAVTIGTYLSDLGFNVDFAPDADVANNPASDTMALRAFGTAGQEVAPFVKAQVEGFAETGVLSCAKHFPGIGGAEGDSHEASIYSSKTIDEMAADEFLPFEAAIEADVPFIMVGHLSTPQATGDDTPASVNPSIVTGVLRDQLGYDGIVTTDSMGMGAVNELYSPDEAAVRAIEAGVDIVLMPADFQTAYQGVLNAIADGRITEGRIDESVTRIVEAKLTLS